MNDLISRQEAIDAADRADYTGLAVEDVKKVTDEVVKELKQLPSAQPERKTGHWIVNVEKENTISGSCSACGWQAHLYEDDVVGMNFCPNCGADMRGEQDE